MVYGAREEQQLLASACFSERRSGWQNKLMSRAGMLEPLIQGYSSCNAEGSYPAFVVSTVGDSHQWRPDPRHDEENDAYESKKNEQSVYVHEEGSLIDEPREQVYSPREQVYSPREQAYSPRKHVYSAVEQRHSALASSPSMINSSRAQHS